MYSKAYLIIIALVVLSNSAFSQVTIKGKVLGSNGKPMPFAEIRVGNPYENHFFTYTVNPDGSYSLQTKYSDFIRLNFTGIYHNSYQFDLLIDKNRKKPYDLNINLSPIVIADSLEPQIIGEFNGFAISGEGAIKMTKLPDGTYSAIVPNNRDTLYYQILIMNGQKPVRSFNGTMSDLFAYDSTGDYISGIITKQKEVEIVYDPGKLYTATDVRRINSKDKAIDHFLVVNKMCNELYNEFKNSNRKLRSGRIRNQDSIERNRNLYIDKFITLLDGEKDKLIRTAVLINLFNVVSNNNDAEKIKNPILKAHASELLKLVKPTSTFWYISPYIPIIAVVQSGQDPLESAYLDEMIKKNPKDVTREDGIAQLMNYANDTRNIEKRDYYYNMLQEQFPNGHAASISRINYAKVKNIEVGKTMPDFRLANLDNPQDTISVRSLRGKYVLIDAWGTWCGPCVAQLKYLDSAYTRFRDKNFTIYSIAFDSPEIVQKFRQKNYKMPWLNSAVTDDLSYNIMGILETTTFPTAILIDPEGKIMALGLNLHGGWLIETLSKVLDSKLIKEQKLYPLQD